MSTGSKSDLALGVDEQAGTLNFPFYNFWAYYPRLTAQDRYFVAYSPDGISWPGLQSGFLFFPQYVHAVVNDDIIDMVYYYGGQYSLHTSPDGLNWTSGQTTSFATSSVAGDPRLASVNNELFAYQFYKNAANSQELRIYHYVNGNFSLIDDPILSGVGNSVGSPCFAELNGTYYLFFRESYSTSNRLRYLTSTDGITWDGISNAKYLIYGQAGHIPSTLDATTMNGNIYIAYKRVDNQRLAYIKYDGSTLVQYTNINNYKTRGSNTPIASDGSKLVISFRDGVGDQNRFVYSYNGLNWTLVNNAPGTSAGHLRILLYTGQ